MAPLRAFACVLVVALVTAGLARFDDPAVRRVTVEAIGAAVVLALAYALSRRSDARP